MKVIRYNVKTIYTDDEGNTREYVSSVGIGYNETNLAIAQKEADNGEYTIIDEEMPEG